MKNWKTTLAGIALGLLTAGPNIIAVATGSGSFKLKDFLTGIGLVVFGLLTKDYNVTGK